MCALRPASSFGMFGSVRPCHESASANCDGIAATHWNFLSATALAATSEAFALGQAYGLGLETMLDVVNVSTGRNSATYDKFPNRVLTGTYDTGFHTRLMAKDVRLFNSVAREVGTLHQVSQAVGAVWNACEDAMPASDFSEIWKYVSRQSRG